MKIKIYLFRLAIGITAFIFGIGIFSVGTYLQSVFSAKAQKIESVAPAKTEQIKIEEITFPKPIVKQANPIIELTKNTDGAEKENEYEFDAGGDYYIIGDLPKGFKDFDTLSITTKNYENVSEENNWEGVSIPPEGYVLTNKEFKFVRINIADKQIAFKTGTRKGISYEFIGKFIDEEEINVGEYTEYAVLEGRLIKMRDGKKIAENQVKLAIQHGC